MIEFKHFSHYLKANLVTVILLKLRTGQLSGTKGTYLFTLYPSTALFSVKKQSAPATPQGLHSRLSSPHDTSFQFLITTIALAPLTGIKCSLMSQYSWLRREWGKPHETNREARIYLCG